MAEENISVTEKQKIKIPTQIFHENYLILRVIGCWPCSKSTLLLNLWAWTSCLMNFYAIIPEMHYAYLYRNNILAVVEATCPTVSVINAAIKVAHCIVYREKLNALIKTLRELWIKNCTTDIQENQRVLYDTARICRILSISYFALMATSATAYNIQPLRQALFDYSGTNSTETGSRILPFKTTYIYDHQKSPAYELTYLGIFISAQYTTFALGGLDPLIVVLICHVACHFKLLNNQIKKITKEYIAGKTCSENENFFKSELRDWVRKHNEAISLVNDLEDSCNVILCIQFVGSSIIICMVLFQLSLAIGDSAKMVLYFPYLNGATMQLFLYSWFGQMLLNETQELANTVYCNPWYERSVTFQRDLSLLMMRSQKPLGVTAAKFYNISIESFCAVMKTAGSYFTLLQTITEE